MVLKDGPGPEKPQGARSIFDDIDADDEAEGEYTFESRIQSVRTVQPPPIAGKGLER